MGKKTVVKKEKLATSEMAASQEYRVAKGINSGTTLNCADNVGIRQLKVFAVLRTGSRMNRLPRASVGSFVIGSVKVGQAKHIGTIQYALVVRQRQPIKRKNGETVYFEDNSAVIVNHKGEMKGNSISGPIAKEAASYGTVAGKSLG
ncbi:MAG: hypothetical protein MHPSP_004267, partial [Paramarteilia canceri]